MKICAIQPAMSATVAENTETAAEWIRGASQQEADLVVFPEMMLTGYDSHLHQLFKEPDWYGRIEEALQKLADVSEETATPSLIGTPVRSGDGYLNALVLLQGGSEPQLAGARGFIVEGWKQLWGFKEAHDRSPVEIDGFKVGSVFCAEASFPDRVEKVGLECSDLILWPSGSVVRGGCSRGARLIASLFGVPVVQSTYSSQVSEVPDGQELGGGVICDSSGEILSEAVHGQQTMLACEIVQKEDGISIAPVMS